MSLPLFVGVTGHRDIFEDDKALLSKTVEEQLKMISEVYPNSEIVMLNSLASGADTLCAQIAVKQKMKLIAPLPMPPEEYRKDFNEHDGKVFDSLLEYCDAFFVCSENNKSVNELSRDDCYLLSGTYIIDNCDILIALYSGSPKRQGGCGTAEIVDMALNGHNGKNGSYFENCSNKPLVITVNTPRKSYADVNESYKTTWHNDPSRFDNKVLFEIERFNADVRNFDVVENGNAYFTSLLSGEILSKDTFLSSISKMHAKADALAGLMKKKFIIALKTIAFMSIVTVLSFLMWDAFESNIFLPLYALMFVVSLFLNRNLKRGDIHRRYIIYRIFAECLRVQFFLSCAGIDYTSTEAFRFSLKSEVRWIDVSIKRLKNCQ